METEKFCFKNNQFNIKSKSISMGRNGYDDHEDDDSANEKLQKAKEIESNRRM